MLYCSASPRGAYSRLGAPLKRLLVLSAVLLAVGGSALAGEARQDFKLVNKTGYEISEVYVSPSKKDDWGDDVLGDDDELEDGSTVNIRFKNAGKTCKWDLKVVYDEDDSSAVWNDIDLCEVSKVTIFYNRKSDKTSATFE
jgi:hypothetical protein